MAERSDALFFEAIVMSPLSGSKNVILLTIPNSHLPFSFLRAF